MKGVGTLVALVLAVGAACHGDAAGRADAAEPTHSSARNTMPLSIKLRDGFRQHEVRIRVDGAEVYRKSGVSTDLTISYADAVVVPVEAARVVVEVGVTGGPGARLDVDPADTPFIDASLLEGELVLRATRTETPIL